ncbi:zinc-dependent alcohol dehydrogenase family protein [Paenibacillus chartarius]|uniref:Zinc-dependent alcohol dehydrogenase family protein n=1 Tax=Paenibacillus chartarius TaxID=747481 RepID=A0ABV6DF85_9BACL
MKAMLLERFGEPEESFRLGEVPRPQAGPGEIVIRVEATSVNPIDCRLRRGLHPQLAPPLPAVLHGDAAGVVAEVGDGVTDLRVGDAVYALIGQGALAEYAVLDARLAARIPGTCSMAEAAALPVVGLTAWYGLIERARLRPGQRALIHAAAGGVGHIALQLARWAGAVVAATASTPEKLAIARQLGAHAAIDYRSQSVESYVRELTDGLGFDVVFDTVGKDNLDRSLEAARPFGQVVTASARSTHDLTPLHSKSLTLHGIFTLLQVRLGVGLEQHGAALARIAELVDAGHVRPLLDERRFTFEQVAEAHRHAESGQAVGKITLTNPWM